jgi:RND superfamily putative drug exporter
MTTQASTQAPGTPRPSRFERLAGWPYSHRRRALLAWVAVLVGVTVASSAVGGAYHNDFSLPDVALERT